MNSPKFSSMPKILFISLHLTQKATQPPCQSRLSKENPSSLDKVLFLFCIFHSQGSTKKHQTDIACDFKSSNRQKTNLADRFRFLVGLLHFSRAPGCGGNKSPGISC